MLLIFVFVCLADIFKVNGLPVLVWECGGTGFSVLDRRGAACDNRKEGEGSEGNEEEFVIVVRRTDSNTTHRHQQQKEENHDDEIQRSSSDCCLFSGCCRARGEEGNDDHADDEEYNNADSLAESISSSYTDDENREERLSIRMQTMEEFLDEDEINTIDYSQHNNIIHQQRQNESNNKEDSSSWSFWLDFSESVALIGDSEVTRIGVVERGSGNMGRRGQVANSTTTTSSDISSNSSSSSSTVCSENPASTNAVESADPRDRDLNGSNPSIIIVRNRRRPPANEKPTIGNASFGANTDERHTREHPLNAHTNYNSNSAIDIITPKQSSILHPASASDSSSTSGGSGSNANVRRDDD